MSSKNSHLTLEDRMIIEKGLTNESSRKSIADTLGKDKSTICKEVKKHRRLKEPSRSYQSPNGTHDCIFIRECSYNGFCHSACQRRQPVPCKRRDRTVEVCNGCSRRHYCRLPKYYYRAEEAHKEYTYTLTDSRQGIDLTSAQARQIADLILPDLKRGISISAILQAHDELTMSEKTLYNYIEQGVLPGIMNLDLNRKVSRKTDIRTRIQYRKRQSRKYLKGRTYTDFQEYLQKHPSASVIEMDTVYNDVSNGPFIQTFMIRDLRVMFGILHSEKTAAAMVSGLQSVKQKIGDELFKRFFSIILTDRGTEFTDAEKMEALGCQWQ